MPSPVLTGFDNVAINAVDATAPLLLDGNVTFSDADGDFNGAYLRISGMAVSDRVLVQNQGTGAGQVGFTYDMWTSAGTITYGGVVIGTYYGGWGSSEVQLTFNAAATAAGIEAVVEHLEWETWDNTPRSSTLTLTFFDAAGNASGDGYHSRPTTTFDAFGAGYGPTFHRLDVNNDGRMDLVVNTDDGAIRYFQNTGSNTAPVYAERTGALNPFASLTGTYQVGMIRDVDGDGDLDVFGMRSGYEARLWRNTGTAGSPVYTAEWRGIPDPFYSYVYYGDLDGDGDLDALGAAFDGTLGYFRNTGTQANPNLVEQTGAAHPLAGFNVSSAALAIGDVDNDGDLDIVGAVYNSYSPFLIRNDGTATAPVFVWAGNPFGSLPGTSAVPMIADFDGDGDNDVLFSTYGGYRYLGWDGPARTLTVTLIDQPGVAQDDAIEGYEGETSGNNVFWDNGSGADTDPDTTLRIIAVNGSAANLGTLLTLASGSLLFVYADGTVYYEAGAAFDYLLQGQTATDSFTYTLAGGDVATATVTVHGIAGTRLNDNILGSAAGETLQAGAGDDIVDGGDGDDLLNGGAGNDYLRGGLGADTLIGGAGNDTYVVDDLGDNISEMPGEGIDTVLARVSWTLTNQTEHLTLGAAGLDIDGSGNPENNTITGNDFRNVLSGVGGNDTLLGKGGDDTLRGGNGTDQLDGGIGADTLEGGAGADDLIGGAGHDWLDGGAGGDGMVGGLGNDTYIVDSASDTVLELAGEGFDEVRSSVSFSLSETVEDLVLTGTGAIDGTGNSGRNVITGNDRANVLRGGGEVDYLHGGAGADTLEGQQGSDRLTAGTGADVFRFTSLDVRLSGQGLTSESDYILDLDFATGDRIDLSAIDADLAAAGDQAFTGMTKFTRHAGEFVWRYTAGTDLTTVEFDIDGDGKPDFRLQISGDHTGGFGNLYTGAGDTDGGWLF